MLVKFKYLIFLLIVMSIFSTSFAQSPEQAKFYKHLAGYFKIDLDTVINIANSGLPDHDIAVVIKLSQLSKTSLDQIYTLRLKGDKWQDIMKVRGASSSDLYFMISGVIKSKIYSQIFAKFDSVHKNKWDTIILSDEEVINMINLRFIYKQHDYSVFEIMSMRDKGLDFVTINDKVHKIRIEMIKKEKELKKQKAKEKKTDNK